MRLSGAKEAGSSTVVMAATLRNRASVTLLEIPRINLNSELNGQEQSLELARWVLFLENAKDRLVVHVDSDRVPINELFEMF